ncbi:MAG: hypothetical protein JWO56_3680, partial [Acidobacteria bacterium]|nr:hypothetical protein [Acidobacteriota bacterium]
PMRTSVRAIAAIALLALPVFAQQPQQPAPSFGETIEVRVINVDVMVTDKSGKPVSGLTKDDFELYENGKKLDITNFAEISGTTQSAAMTRTAQPNAAATPAAPAPAPSAEAPDVRSRKVALFIDNSTLTPPSRAKVVAAAKDFLAKAIRPADQVMIVTWNPGLKVNLEFTNDAAAAARTLDSITTTSSLGGQSARDVSQFERELFDIIQDYKEIQPHQLDLSGNAPPPPPPPIHIALDHAAGYAQREQHAQREVAGALKGVISSLRAIEGRKALVFVGEQLDDNPGRRLYAFVEQIRTKFLGGESVNYSAEADAYRDRELEPSIAALANASGVTLYPMHAGGISGDLDNISAENNGMNYSVPTAGVNAMSGSTPLMQRLASDTGGVALLGTNNFTLGFTRISDDLTSYYSLGFRATGPRQDAVRPLTVKLKNPRGLQVRSRPQYIEKSMTSEMNDTVSANLFFPIAHNDLAVKLSSGTSQPATPDEVTLPIDIKLPTANVTLLPDGTDLTGRLSIYIAFVRGNGAVSKVTRQEQQFRFPADSLKRRKELTVRTTLTMDTAVEAVSVGVMDEASHATGYAMLKLAPPAQPPVTPATKTGVGR